MSVRQGNNIIAISNVAIDGQTISANSNNSLQSLGTVNKNQAAGALGNVFDWVGTLSEYTTQDIENTHPDWICYITDDFDAQTYEAYSKTQSDSRYYQKSQVNSLLEDKVNLNADNLNAAGKTLISGLGRYSNRFEQLQVIHGASYTAPEAGFFTLDAILANEAGNRLYLLLRNKIPYVFNNRTAGMAFGIMSTYRQYTWVPVEKGDQVVITAQSTSPSPDFNLRFFYANGVPTESPTFTEVEYIEGTYNAQYIKSGIVTDSSMKIYCKIQNLGNSLNFGWGARNATYDGSQMSISATNQNVVIDWFGAAAADRWTVSTSVTSSDIFELTIENNVGVLTKNGTNIATHTFTPTATITRELYITGFDNNGVIGAAGASGRLYAFKIWDSNNDLILDLVPAKDSSDVACVYNRVTDTIYYNQGTGSYIAGPDVN